MARTAIYRHRNNTDTLDAIVLTTGAWSASGAVVGDHSAEPTKYVFTGLADDTAYEVRIRSGASPAASDVAVAGIPVPMSSGDSQGVATLLDRITDTIQTADEADADQTELLELTQRLVTDNEVEAF